jgi:uncharacterized protein YkwD
MFATLLTASLAIGTQASPPSLGEEVLRLTNAAREKQGLTPLRLNEALTKAAQAHADDMAKKGYFSHEAPDGTDMVVRIDRVGYRYRGIAENIAMGQRSPQQAVDGWLKSPGHRRNMLNASYRDLGVGISKDGKGVLRWVQVFGTSR